MKTAAFFALSLFIALFLSLGSSAEQLQKRHCSSAYKRNVLDKRNYYEKKCKCSVAQASFTGQSNYVGYSSYFQNECGETLIFGQFTGGFYKGVNYTFNIVNDCGEVLFPLGDMNIVVNEKGGTELYSNLFPNINLDCDRNGLKFTKSALTKRNNYCKPSYRKRAPSNSYMQIQPNNGQTPIDFPPEG